MKSHLIWAVHVFTHCICASSGWPTTSLKRSAGTNPMDRLALYLLSSSPVSMIFPWGQHVTRSSGVIQTDDKSLASQAQNEKAVFTSAGRRDAIGLAGLSAASAFTPNLAFAIAGASMLQQRSIGQPVISGGILPLTIGFGTCLIPPAQTARLVSLAIQVGYRLIDTAQRYNNEEGVGQALRAAFTLGKLKRQDVFVTTKVWVDNMGYDSTIKSVRESAKKLGSLKGGIDLVLIHWPGEFVPVGDAYGEATNTNLRKETWEALEKLQADGVVKHIGVSNFGERHLKELLEYAKIKPWVNQFEVHPYNQRSSLVKLCQDEGIAVNAYSPLGGKGNDGQLTDELLRNPVLKRIGGAYGKTAAETILRWHLQRAITPIPKSSNEVRMAENYNVFDFELTSEEMDEIAKLDRGQFVVFDADQLA